MCSTYKYITTHIILHCSSLSVAICKTLFMFRFFNVWFCPLGLDTHVNNNKTYIGRNCLHFRGIWVLPDFKWVWLFSFQSSTTCFVDHCSFPLFFFWPLYCLSFFDLLLLITPLVSSSFSIHYIKYTRLVTWPGKFCLFQPAGNFLLRLESFRQQTNCNNKSCLK